MRAVLFTQYIRPTGRPEPVEIDRPENIASLADTVIASGYRFECEVLTTGMVNLECLKGDELLSNEVVPNGLGMDAAVDRLVLEAYRKLFNKNVSG